MGTLYGYRLLICLVLFFATVFYLRRNSTSFFLRDRSENYDVKVLPGSNENDLASLSSESFSYLAVIDAGSSGCRAHVYRYGKLQSLEGPLYILPEHKSFKVKPGLSSFEGSPQSAGPSLMKLIDFLKENVPQGAWSVTPIWLKATAGLRLLELKKSEAILYSVRSFLSDTKQSPFYFKPSYAQVISGNEEGAFGWIAYNYLKRVIGPLKLESILPYAVVEMGGASSQVSV